MKTFKKIPLTGRGWDKEAKAAAKAVNRLIGFHQRWCGPADHLQAEEMAALIENVARDLWIEGLLEKAQESGQ